MDFFGVLTLIGGLALTLYGMNTMGESLAKLSGGRLEKILEQMTSNRFKAVLLGAGVTALIQSSSTTTVMVVGFVNSGIMKLNQVVGIIMGANIGTTVTSWLLALVGIDSSNFFLQMLKPSSFAPVLAIIGVFFLLFSKKDKMKDIAHILISFAILMFGMTTMSDAVAPLAEVPGFANFMTRFSNPVLGVLAGAVLTGIIQSSAASIGILQALCATGSITVGIALPIIMGQNIGTCVTALISSIGAKRNARRAAMIHLYFNVIGTIIFMLLFYALDGIIGFIDLNMIIGVEHVALIHTIFNVTAVIIMFPFAGLLEKLAIMTIPQTEEEKAGEAFDVLDNRFLETPGYAVSLCRDVTMSMAGLVQEEVNVAMGLFKGYSESGAERVGDLESRIDRYEDVLGKYMVKLSNSSLSKDESRTLAMLLHSITDFERISDHALNLMKSAREMNEKKLAFSEDAVAELDVFSQAVHNIMDLSFEAFETGNRDVARRVEPMKGVIANLEIELKDRHVQRLQTGNCTNELGFILSDILINYERISDHCSNLAIDIMQARYGGYDAHAYVVRLKDVENEEFASEFMSYTDKFRLPDQTEASGETNAIEEGDET